MSAKAPTPQPEPGPPPPPKLKFNRRIVTLENLEAIIQEIHGPDHVISGTAMHMITNDLWKLRMLCMMLVQANKKGDKAEVEGILQKLELII